MLVCFNYCSRPRLVIMPSQLSNWLSHSQLPHLSFTYHFLHSTSLFVSCSSPLTEPFENLGFYQGQPLIILHGLQLPLRRLHFRCALIKIISCPPSISLLLTSSIHIRLQVAEGLSTRHMGYPRSSPLPRQKGKWRPRRTWLANRDVEGSGNTDGVVLPLDMVGPGVYQV